MMHGRNFILNGYSFLSYTNNPEDSTIFVNATATTNYIAKDGLLWIETGRGLEKFKCKTGKRTHYGNDPENRGLI
jgi:hypothetical protein